MENINEIYEQLDQKFIAFLDANDKKMPTMIYMTSQIAIDLVKHNTLVRDPLKPFFGNLQYNGIPISVVLDPTYTFDYFDEDFVQLARAYNRWKMPLPKFESFELDTETGEYPEMSIEVVEIPIAVLVPKYRPQNT